MKRFKGWASAAVFAVLGLQIAAAGSNLKDWHKSEAGALLNKDEEKEFKKLKDDKARQEWVDQFWKSMDPTLDTPENEAKDVFDQRSEMVKKNLGEDGWESDLGKALLILGPPAEQKQEQGGRRPSAGGSIANDDGDADTGEDMGPDVSDGRRLQDDLLLDLCFR